MSHRNIGGMAESKLEEWAHQVGITPNITKNDKEGWDYLLQFPFENDQSVPTLDQRASRIECLVQVKGTDSEKTRISISLSNWERLVRTPLPAFFLVVNYLSQNFPSKAYLIHVNKKYIEAVLHRLRKLKPEEEKNLHRKTLDLSWTENDRLNTLDGEGLKKAINSHVNAGMAEYCKEKLDVQKNVGEPIPFLLQFTSVFDSEENYWNTLIDFAIGLEKNLPTSKFLIQKDIRFGIPAETQEMNEGILSVTRQPIIECNIIFKNELNTLSSKFNADLYVPNWFFPGTEIPKEYFKERVVFEIGDATIRPFDNEVTINFKFIQAKSIKPIVEHANLWRLVQIITEPSGFSLEIVSKDGLVIGSGKQNLPLEGTIKDEGLLEIARAVDNAYFVARYFNFPISKTVHLDQIMKQETRLSELKQICDVNNQIDSVQGTVEFGAAFSEEVAVPIVKRIVFNGLSLLVVFAVSGKFIRNDVIEDMWQNFTIEKPRRILQKHSIISNDYFSNDDADKLLNQITETLDAMGIDIIIPKIMKM
jgi:hypothetical protein